MEFFNITNGDEVIGRMIPPANNLTLSNTTLSGTYQAQNLITIDTNVSVSGTATLKAGNTINLKPGFTASSGCNLTITVGAVTSDKYYYLKDHLGSIRVVVDTVGEIVSYSDYDAWGMILNGRSSNFGFADDKYKFTGKELDTETGYFHFGARAYDGRIGRWNVIDPLFEKYPNVSPYNYALNNPLRYIDPNGKFLIDGKYLSFSSSWQLQFYLSKIGIPSRDNLFNQNATIDFLKGVTVDKVVGGILTWAGEKGLATGYSIGKGLYDFIGGLSDYNKTYFLWRGEQEMIKDIYNLTIFDGTSGEWKKLVVAPEELFLARKKYNLEEVGQQLDKSFFINTEIGLSEKDLIEQVKILRQQYATKAARNSFYQRRWESTYDAENQ
jgi:RHS repeat-associated protein